MTYKPGPPKNQVPPRKRPQWPLPDWIRNYRLLGPMGETIDNMNPEMRSLFFEGLRF